jgi:hypothetical protein
MNFTAEADEHTNRINVEDALLRKIHQGEVEVGWLILLPNHLSPICLGSSVIDNMILAGSIKPRAFYLNLRESATDVEYQVVRKIVSDRAEYAPTTL